MEESSIPKKARTLALHKTYMEYYEEWSARRRPLFEKSSHARSKLREIHHGIVEREALFRKERRKWEAAHSYLCENKMDSFFMERCHWEAEFKETYFKPLYNERHVHAQTISCFWSMAMSAVSKQITDKDEMALKYLVNIESKRTFNLRGFELKFTFSDNPYFKNNILTKTYDITDDDGSGSASLKAFGTKIDWYPSQNLTQKKNGKHCKSFFDFFKSYATLDPLHFDMKADQLKGDLPENYEVGLKIRDKVIPHGAPVFGCYRTQTCIPDHDQDDDDDDEDDNNNSDEEAIPDW